MIAAGFNFFAPRPANDLKSFNSFGKIQVLGKKSNSWGCSLCRRFKFLAKYVFRVIWYMAGKWFAFWYGFKPVSLSLSIPRSFQYTSNSCAGFSLLVIRHPMSYLATWSISMYSVPKRTQGKSIVKSYKKGTFVLTFGIAILTQEVNDDLRLQDLRRGLHEWTVEDGCLEPLSGCWMAIWL